MPDKEGSDDEKKSTKSVVNKKQKQMMGEEGYDIARDMGKVSPSKDKKDATTMPVSDEVKKTQKKSKGKSAVELVKAKYGKSVMNVGKKKANEELNLSKVAEAFGGYIVEAPVDDDDEIIRSSPRQIKKQKAKVDQEERKKTSPKPGEKAAERKIVKQFIDKQKQIPSVDQPMSRPASSQFVDPKTDPFDDDTVKSARTDKGFDDLAKAVATGTTKSGEDAKKAAKPRRATRYRGKYTPDERVARIKAQIDKREGGSPKKDYASRLDKAVAKQVKQTVKTGETPKGIALPAAPEGAPKGSPQKKTIDQETGERITRQQNILNRIRRQGMADSGATPVGTMPAFKDQRRNQQQDQQQNQQQQQGSENARKNNYKNFIDQTQFINKKTGERFDMSNPKQKQEYLRQQGKGYRSRKETRPEKNQSDISKNGGLSTTGGALDKPKEPSIVSKSPLGKVGQFAKNNPVLGIAAYDIGKGILSKIMKLRGPGIVGGKAGFRSAGG